MTVASSPFPFVKLGPDPFQTLRQTTIGLGTRYPVITREVIDTVFPREARRRGSRGTHVPLSYFDSTASTLMIQPVHATFERAVRTYANAHSVAHPSARISTYFYRTAHDVVMRFLNADLETQSAVFVGSGATGAVNRVARSLFRQKGEGDARDTVVVTEMEHHANLLPWMQNVPRCVPVRVDRQTGTLSVENLRAVLEAPENRGRVRLVALTGVSNVTGIINPLAEMSPLVHAAGAELFVDAAQMVAHLKVDMRAMGIDYLVLSGHKVYAPLSPGVLVMPKGSSPAVPDELGGGIVTAVALDRFGLTRHFPDREEAGTPNIIGAIMLASALLTLEEIGMDLVAGHEKKLTRQILEGLRRSNDVVILGDSDLDRTPRVGVISFNINGLHHAIVAQALADYFAIAVRNECFCAHPYVTALLGVTPAQFDAFERSMAEDDHSNIPGAVRASLGIYNNDRDVHRLILAIGWVVKNRNRLLKEYFVDRDGVARRHDGWQVDPLQYASLPGCRVAA